MKIGFTGTQVGITNNQRHALKFLIEFIGITEIHVGDCIGADTDFYHLVKDFNSNIPTIGHIPEYDNKRSKLLYSEQRAPKPYLVRNHDIVDESDVLVVTPKESEEQLRSGTWATFRYAKKTNKKIIIIFPDGKSEFFNF